jgi:ATP-dependent helicase/DNAse subunit B
MRLIRGAPGSGKTALVFREFRGALKAGRNGLRIVVPTATLVRYYQHELARSGLVFNPGNVVTLSRFALECAPDLKLAPADLVRALTRASLARLQLPEFAQVAATQGMLDIILETITLFENADCTPERLSKARGLSPHAKAFLRIWKDVDAAIVARGFATRGHVFRRAASTAGLSATAVWFDGFLRFSPLEGALLRTLAVSCDLTLTLTNSPATDDTYRFALELGAKDHLLPGETRRPQTIAVKAPSPEREADEIARRILELHAGGTPFPAIAVALRDVETWLPLLRTTFDRFGIPARSYFSTPARKHPVAVFLGGLISCALADWDFAAALEVLRANPAWGHNAHFDRFDFHVREAIPGRGAQGLLALCESDSLRPKLADCLSISSWLEDRLPPAVWQRRFEQMADSLYRLRTVPEPAGYAAIDAARSHAAGLRAWSAALETAVNCHDAAEGPLTLAQFYAAVSGALDSAAMQVPDNRHNVVHVMSAFEARQWEVRALFVCGMTARDYPRRHSQNLLFPDGEIESLRKAGIPLRTVAEDDRDEESLFGSLKTRATSLLVLTASARDAGGVTIVPSRHFTEANPCPGALVRIARHTVLPPVPAPGQISQSSLAGLAERHLNIRLTALEDLLKCRFRFFAGRSLELKGVPDRPADRMTKSVIGLIVHAAMEVWIADRTQDFVTLFEKAFDEDCHKRHIPPGYNVEVERIELRRIARDVSLAVHWPFVESEAEVDCDFELPGGVTVRCRIDRIDRIGGNDCVIVDYKSGKVANVDKLLESETSLQGPLYAYAVREKRQLNTVAMVFLAIRESKAIGWGLIPGSNLELAPMPPDWIESARERTIARLAGFLAGDVHAEPAHKDNCKYCDFKHACRVEQFELVEIGAGNAT